MTDKTEKRTDIPQIAAVIGGGVIGGGWAARFLLNGWRVHILTLTRKPLAKFQKF